jgi:steroid delta-isomerase-like uncharacterized protein
MQEQATRKVMESYYEAFNRQDWTTMLSLLHPDVVHDINQGEAEKGSEAFAGFLARMAHAYQERVHELEIFVNSSGSRAAVEYFVSGTYLHSEPGFPAARGQRYTLRGGGFFEIQAGKITRVTNYYNVKEWVKLVEA